MKKVLLTTIVIMAFLFNVQATFAKPMIIPTTLQSRIRIVSDGIQEEIATIRERTSLGAVMERYDVKIDTINKVFYPRLINRITYKSQGYVTFTKLNLLINENKLFQFSLSNDMHFENCGGGYCNSAYFHNYLTAVFNKEQMDMLYNIFYVDNECEVITEKHFASLTHRLECKKPITYKSVVYPNQGIWHTGWQNVDFSALADMAALCKSLEEMGYKVGE